MKCVGGWCWHTYAKFTDLAPEQHSCEHLNDQLITRCQLTAVSPFNHDMTANTLHPPRTHVNPWMDHHVVNVDM